MQSGRWRTRSRIRPHRSSASSLHLQMLEVVARLDPLRAAERRVVEVGPRANPLAVPEGDERFFAPIEAGIGLARPHPLDFIEGGQHRDWVEHAMDFAPDLAVACWDRARINAEIEQCGIN